MTATSGLLVTAGFFAGIAFSGERSITVHLHDYVGVSPETMSEARQVATDVLATAAVGVDWRQAQTAAVLLPPQGSTEFVMRLLPEPPPTEKRLRRSVLGYVQPTGEGHRRWLASIYFPRVSLLAGTLNVPAATLLGYAIAHELGHLLIGPRDHSLSGLMRCPWGSAELREACRGRLRFVPGEAVFSALAPPSKYFR